MGSICYKALLCLAVGIGWAGSATAAAGRITSDFGGHIRLQGQFAAYQDTGYGDGILDLRLKEDLYAGERQSLEVHYEAVGYAGGLREKLTQQYPLAAGDVASQNPLLPAPVSDATRLMDLTAVIRQTGNQLVYHRIDRLAWKWQPDWGVLEIGRQAVTWGNGRLFNPMDLFNPFSPVDFNRDYKIGDDMIHLTVPTASSGEWQALYVCRRNPSSGAVANNQSSLAAKTHLFIGTTEIDLMAASHYDQAVLGTAARGYVKDAAWWWDTVWQTAAASDAYVSAVAGLDYAWVRWGKNFYGQVEAYYNGIGSSDAAAALQDPALVARLARGEIFTVGKWYMDAVLQTELHPLVTSYLTFLISLTDGSGFLQPRLDWNTTQNTELIFGGSFFFGPPGSEFGGYEITGTAIDVEPADTLFVWLTWYF